MSESKPEVVKADDALMLVVNRSLAVFLGIAS